MAGWYYYNENGIKTGPIGDRDLKQLVRQGTIVRETVIETESGQKAKAEKVKGLFPPTTPTSGSPPPSAAVAPQIAFTCSSCNRKLQVKAEHAGRTLRCPTCQATITVPVAKPATVPVAKPAAVPVTKPAAVPIAKPAAVPIAKPAAVPTVPASEWGDDLTRLLEESTQSDAIKAKNEQLAREQAKVSVRQPIKRQTSDGIGYFDVLFKKYAKFDGRARRKEFWMFYLTNNLLIPILAGVVIALLVALTGSEALLGLFGLLGIYGMFIFIPSLALTVRRLHDIGCSGVVFLVIFVPFVGPFIFLILMIRDSQPGKNHYGPNPKGY